MILKQLADMPLTRVPTILDLRSSRLQRIGQRAWLD
jgi:hypothetical protein